MSLFIITFVRCAAASCAPSAPTGAHGAPSRQAHRTASFAASVLMFFWLFVLKLCVLFLEAFNAAGSVYELLFSGEERMTFGTDFNREIAPDC